MLAKFVMKRSLLAVCFVCLWTVSVTHEYIITRRMPNASSPWTNNNADYFRLPASLCGESEGATQCPLMGGRKIGDCQCACNMTDDHVTYKSTFGFYDEEWKCLNNSALRQSTGCQFFPHNSVNDPIPTISQSYISFYIRSWFYDHRIRCYDWVVLRPHKNSTYQKCNGIWEGLNRTILEKNFNLDWHFGHGHLYVSPSEIVLNYLCNRHMISLTRTAEGTMD